MTLNEVNKQTLEYCEAETQIEECYSGLCVCVCLEGLCASVQETSALDFNVGHSLDYSLTHTQTHQNKSIASSLRFMYISGIREKGKIQTKTSKYEIV